MPTTIVKRATSNAAILIPYYAIPPATRATAALSVCQLLSCFERPDESFLTRPAI